MVRLLRLDVTLVVTNGGFLVPLKLGQVANKRVFLMVKNEGFKVVLNYGQVAEDIVCC